MRIIISDCDIRAMYVVALLVGIVKVLGMNDIQKITPNSCHGGEQLLW